LGYIHVEETGEIMETLGYIHVEETGEIMETLGYIHVDSLVENNITNKQS